MNDLNGDGPQVNGPQTQSQRGKRTEGLWEGTRCSLVCSANATHGRVVGVHGWARWLCKPLAMAIERGGALSSRPCAGAASHQPRCHIYSNNTSPPMMRASRIRWSNISTWKRHHGARVAACAHARAFVPLSRSTGCRPRSVIHLDCTFLHWHFAFWTFPACTGPQPYIALNARPAIDGICQPHSGLFAGDLVAFIILCMWLRK